MKYSCLLGLWLVVLIVTANVGSVGYGADFTVTREDDPAPNGCAVGDCSLREAILDANETDGADTIVLPAGRYVLSIKEDPQTGLTTGDLDITTDLTLVGAGADTTTIVNATENPSDRIFHVGVILVREGKVTSISSPTVQISGVTIQNGDRQTIPSSFGASVDTGSLPLGGAIFNGGILTLTDVVLVNNNAVIGGAIFNAAQLTLNHCTLSHNVAVEGGGIANIGFAMLTDVMLKDNHSNGGGGAILNVRILNDIKAELTLRRGAVSHNMAASFGGGIFNLGAELSIEQGSSIDRNMVNGAGGGIANAGFVIASADSGSEEYSSPVAPISFAASANLVDSTVDSNMAESDGGGMANGLWGRALTTAAEQVLAALALRGGVTFTLATNAQATVRGTTFSNNKTANNGGGIWNFATATMTNSTVSGNEARQFGGGIFNQALINLDSVTIANNTADSDADKTGSGGGIFNGLASGGEFSRRAIVNFKNTLIAHNTDNSGQAPDCDARVAPLTSQRYNLIQDVTSCPIQGDLTGNLIGQDPHLEPLANNGGLTLTHALPFGSPAVDHGDPTCLSTDTDQRGGPRVLDGDGDRLAVCDIGSYELKESFANLLISETVNVSSSTLGNELTYVLTVLNNGPDAATNVMVKDAFPAGVRIVSAMPSQGTCSRGCPVSCDLGTINNLGSATVTITAVPTRPGVVASTASAMGMERDPITENNSVQVRTLVALPLQEPTAARVLPSVFDFLDNPQLAYVLIGSPLLLTPADPLSILQPVLGRIDPVTWRLFRFDASASPGVYRELSDNSDSFFDFSAGRGSWLIARNGGAVTVAGGLPDVTLPFTITLPPGENQIATPFNFPAQFSIDWTQCVIPLLQGEEEELPISPCLFSFDGTRGGYALTAAMKPMQGYWAFNQTNEPFLLPIDPECVRLDVTAAALAEVCADEREPTPQEPTRATDWRAQLLASVGAVKDSDNYLGEDGAGQDGKDPLDYPEPPPIHGLSLSFPHPEWGSQIQNFTTDIRGPSTEGPRVWNFEITSALPNAQVELRWHLVGIDGEKLTLHDVEGNQTVKMGQACVYSYDGGQGGVRHFQITTE